MFDKTIELNPNFSLSFTNKGFYYKYFDLGNSLKCLKRFKEAELMFKKAKEI